MKAPTPLPSQEELRDLLDYNPETGDLFWKRSGKGRNASLIAGIPKTNGYINVGIRQKYYGAHRLIWMWLYGEDPGIKIVDHINQDPSDNRASNLRLAIHGENQKNARRARNNTSGFKGVIWLPKRARWSGQIYHNGIRHRIADCKTIEDAVELVRTLRKRLHAEFANHG